MRQDPDESGIVPDDHLLVRPYVAPSGPPPRSTAPAWPQAAPCLPRPGTRSGIRGPGSRSGGRPRPRPRFRSAPGCCPWSAQPLPFAVLTLLSLAAVGALVLLLSGPDAQPPRAGAPAELSVPMLRGRSSNSGAEAGVPGPTASAPSPAASTSPTPSRAPTASASQGSKPPSSAGPSASGPPSSSGTLRMGDTGPEVRALQELLYAQGFTYVSVNGVYDSQTKRGVGQLQRDRSIKGDSPGVYGPATQAAMR